MDNGVLVFIIIGLGAVIVWQASKLKQYQRFERMMPDAARPDAARATKAGTTATAATPTPAQSAAAEPAAGDDTPATRVSSSQMAADAAAASGTHEADHIEEAKRVQLIMARCRYAEFYLEQLDDDYEREEFRRIVTESVDISRGISDPLLESTALEPLVHLLDDAGWAEWRDQLLARVSDDLVRQRILEHRQREELATA